MPTLKRLLTACLAAVALAFAPASVLAASDALAVAEAFIDTDPGEGSGVPLFAADGGFSASFETVYGLATLSGLPAGTHAVYVRFKDDAGTWSAPIGQSFELTAGSTGEPPPGDPGGEPLPPGFNRIVAAEAFFDNDPGIGNGIALPATDGTFDTRFETVTGLAAIAGLAPGAHSVYYRFRDATGLWSAAIGQSFEVTAGASGEPPPGDPGGEPLPPGHNRLVAAEAFFDSDPGVGKGIPLPASDGDFDTRLETVTGLASLSGMASGPHTVYFRFRDATGLWSAALGQSFYLTPGSPGAPTPDGTNNIEAAEAFIDTDPGPGRGVPLTIAEDGSVDSPVEQLRGTAALAALRPGIHVVHVRVLDSTGVWSPTTRQSFYLYSGATDPGGGAGGIVTLVAAEVRVDDEAAVPVSADDGAFDGLVETVSLTRAVSEAYHTFSVRFRDSQGLWSGSGSGGVTPPSLPNDTDWDGLPDDWERYWFGNLSQSGQDDPNGDGYSNFEEQERGLSPLLGELGGGLTISGLVRDPYDQPVQGVAICVSSALVNGCNVHTDAFGHYVLGAGGTLPSGLYRVEPLATPETGPYTFLPTSAEVTVGATHVTGVDFRATYVPDATAPETVITAGPAEGATLAARTVPFAWSGSDDRGGVLQFSYRLDDQPWSAYATATSATLTGIADGPHRFHVRARDTAGNEDATPAERGFSVDATPPLPAVNLSAATTDTGIRIQWGHSPSADVALYRLYWNSGSGDIDYTKPLASVTYPTNAYAIAGLSTEGIYRFGLRAADRVGNQELNTHVVAEVNVQGLAVTVSVANDTYDRGQDVPVVGTVMTGAGVAVAEVPVAIAVRSNSATRTFTSYTNAQGQFAYTFQPLAGEAGSYAVEAAVTRNGLERRATDSFRILGLWLQPSSLTLDLSMNAGRTVDLQLRNIGDVPLSGLQYAVEDLAPTDPLTAAINAALPDRLEPGQQVNVPVALTSAAGDAPARPASVRVRAQSTEGSVETTVVNVRLANAVAQPVIEPQPLKVGVRPGDATVRTLKVTNAGYAPIAAARLALSQPDAFPWVQVLSGELGTLAPQQTKEVQIRLSPPAGMALGTHVLQLDLAYDGKLKSAYVTAEIAANDLGAVSVKVHDDTGSVVAGAKVSLISKVFYVNTTADGGRQEYNNVIQGTTDAVGGLLLADVPAGEYRYLVQAPGHDPFAGEIRVEPGTEPLPLGVILVTNLVNVTFQVTPTTIQDQYEVTLQITYATNLTKPTLYVRPSPIGLSFFPEEPQGGVISVTNTSNHAAVRDLRMSSAALDATYNELEVVFSNGAKVIELPELGPKETIQVPYTARIPNAATATLDTRQLGNITVSGKYTFSIDGQAKEGTTTTPIPVLYSRPSDLRLPSISFVNDETDGNLHDLEYQGTSYRMSVVSNRNVQFAFDFDPEEKDDLKAISHLHGGPGAASIIENNLAHWWGAFNSPPPLRTRGDTVTFDVTGLEEALEAQMYVNRERFLNHSRSVGFYGQWADRPAPDAYLIPVTITTVREGGIVVSQCIGCGLGDPPRPPVPTLPLPEQHGEVKIQILQKIGLEREAFDVALGLTPNVAQLDNVTIDLKVMHPDGTDASALFYKIVTQQSGLSSLAGGTAIGPVNLGWQLVPSSAAGGDQPGGRSYQFSASIRYAYQGKTYTYDTPVETYTVLPMPKLKVEYSAPYVVMAGKPAKIRVRVTNEGAGEARGLTIASAQPEIVDNPNGIAVSFAITGSSATASPATFAPGATTITFDTVPPNGTVEGYWALTTTRHGYFIDFTASLKHLSYKGLEIDPLISEVTTDLVPAIGGQVTQTGCGSIVLTGLTAKLWRGGTVAYQDAVDDGGVYYLPDLEAGPGYRLDLDGPGEYRLLSLPDVTVLADQPMSIIASLVDVAKVDADLDGLPDCYEYAWFGNLDHDSAGDPDGDGLLNGQEYVIGTRGDVLDTDGDGVPDGAEDADADGLSNIRELELGTDPTASDSDADGASDGVEVSLGTDPRDPTSQPDRSRPLKIVLLGDSYSAGNGARKGTETDFFDAEGCYRSHSNWAERYVGWLKGHGYDDAQYINRACHGAVTNDLFQPRKLDDRSGTMRVSGLYTPGEPVPGINSIGTAAVIAHIQRDYCHGERADDDEYYGTPEIRNWAWRTDLNMTDVWFTCSRFVKEQIRAIGQDTDVILMTMGGNDAGFATIVKQCFVAGFRDPESCKRAIESAREQLPAISNRLREFFNRLRESPPDNQSTFVHYPQVHPHTRVFLLSYPFLVGGEAFYLHDLDNAAMWPYEVSGPLRALQEEADRWQRIAVEEANGAAGYQFVVFVDQVKEHFRGHEPDPSAADQNDDGWLWELADIASPFDRIDSTEAYHPNRSGHFEISRLLADLDIRAHFSQPFNWYEDVDLAFCTVPPESRRIVM